MESSKTEPPPLPEPGAEVIDMHGSDGWAVWPESALSGEGWIGVYTADQMREYALAAIREAVAAQRERDAQICEELEKQLGEMGACEDYGAWKCAAAIRGATSPEGK